MIELVIIIVLVLLNGVFAGAEIAVLTVRRTRLSELRDAGHPSAGALSRLRRDTERFLATVQIGITVIGATAAAFGGAALADDLAPYLARVPALASAADEIALAGVVVVVSYLSLVLGELVPKSLALMFAERYALFIARPMVWLGRIARPAVWLLTASSNLLLRVFGDRTSFMESRLSRDEVQQIVEEAAESGTVGVQSGEIAARALAFDHLDAADVMVPREEMQTIARTATLADLAAIARHGHARLPVHDRTPDDIVGFVNVREAIGRGCADPDAFRLDESMHTVPFVPETLAAPRLLRDLQRLRSHLAIIVDERGTVRGLVTIEDLVEELVGEIYSENDAPTELVAREARGVAVVPGSAPVHHVNRQLDLHLPEEDDYSTVAGLCLHLAGRIPAIGDVLHVDGIALEIAEASPRRIRRVRIRYDGESETP